MNVPKGYHTAIVKNSGQVEPSHPWDHKVEMMKGLKRITNLYKQDSQCQDKCSALYDLKLEQYLSKPKLSPRILDVLEMILNKQVPESNMKKIFSVLKAILKCAKEEPEICPFQKMILKELIDPIKKEMKRKKGPQIMMNKPFNRRGRQLKTFGSKDYEDEEDWFEDDWENESTKERKNRRRDQESNEENREKSNRRRSESGGKRNEMKREMFEDEWYEKDRNDRENNRKRSREKKDEMFEMEYDEENFEENSRRNDKRGQTTKDKSGRRRDEMDFDDEMFEKRERNNKRGDRERENNPEDEIGQSTKEWKIRRRDQESNEENREKSNRRKSESDKQNGKKYPMNSDMFEDEWYESGQNAKEGNNRQDLFDKMFEMRERNNKRGDRERQNNQGDKRSKQRNRNEMDEGGRRNMNENGKNNRKRGENRRKNQMDEYEDMFANEGNSRRSNERGQKNNRKRRPNKQDEGAIPEIIDYDTTWDQFNHTFEKPTYFEDPWDMFDDEHDKDDWYDWIADNDDDDYEWDDDYDDLSDLLEHFIEDYDEENDDFGSNGKPKPNTNLKPGLGSPRKNWLSEILNCGSLNKRCDGKPGFEIVPQCACHLLWARNSETDNRFCGRLSEIEKDDLVRLATLLLRQDLKILPQDRKADKKLMKVLFKGMKHLMKLGSGPILPEDLILVKDELISGLTNITQNFTQVGELPILVEVLRQFSLQDVEQFTTLLNEVMGFFKLGQSCDFSAEVGTFPTREEFCQLTLGETYVKNLMPCQRNTSMHHEYDTVRLV